MSQEAEGCGLWSRRERWGGERGICGVACGPGEDGLVRGGFVGVAADGGGASADLGDAGPSVVSFAVDHEFEAEEAAAAVEPGAVRGELIGVVAGDLEHDELVGLEVFAGADLNLAAQFGGAVKSFAAGNFADCVAGLFGNDDQGVGIEAERGAGAAEARSGGEGEVGDAVVIEIEMDQAGIFWNVDVGWSENNFSVRGLSKSEEADSSGRGGCGVSEKAFVDGER